MADKIPDFVLGKIKTLIARPMGLSFERVQRTESGYEEGGIAVSKNGRLEFTMLRQYARGTVSCYIIETDNKRYLCDDKDWLNIEATVGTYYFAQKEAAKNRQ